MTESESAEYGGGDRRRLDSATKIFGGLGVVAVTYLAGTYALHKLGLMGEFALAVVAVMMVLAIWAVGTGWFADRAGWSL